MNTQANARTSDRRITDRRSSATDQIAFYEQQAKLAEMGLTGRRSAEFFRRQAEYFRAELAGQI